MLKLKEIPAEWQTEWWSYTKFTKILLELKEITMVLPYWKINLVSMSQNAYKIPTKKNHNWIQRKKIPKSNLGKAT
jgi:hypothetical protein